MRGFVSFHINLFYNIEINSLLSKNDKYFFYITPIEEKLFLILYNKLI